jgi:hypothetical protein
MTDFSEDIFSNVQLCDMSRSSVVGVATGYGLDDTGTGVRFQVGSRFFFLQIVQIGSGFHPGHKGGFAGDKAAGV